MSTRTFCLRLSRVHSDLWPASSTLPLHATRRMLLPDPMSTGLVLSWAISGCVGNRVDAGLQKLLKGSVSWMRGLEGQPANHDVARAVRLAQMEALAYLLDVYVNPGGRAPELVAISTPAFVGPLRAYCRAETARAGEANFVLARAGGTATELLTRAIDQILAPPLPNGPTADVVTKLAAVAEDAVLEELRAALRSASAPPPARSLALSLNFEALMRGRRSGEGGYLAVFGRFIAERLKTDERFRTIFTSGQLAHLLSEVAGVALGVENIRRLLEERFGGVLEEIRAGVVSLRIGQEALQVQVESGIASVHDRIDDLLARVSAEKGVPRATLVAILFRMGEAHVPEENVEKVLEAKAAEYLSLREQLVAFAEAHQDTAVEREEVAAMLDTGDLAAAGERLDTAYARELAAGHDHLRSAAALRADRAGVDRLQLRYSAAAAKYAEAAKLVAFDALLEITYQEKEARSYFEQGDEFGDNAALELAISRWQAIVALQRRSEIPLDWAQTQNCLGMALKTLGSREPGTARLEEAVAAYNVALQEWTRESVPLAWAAAQANLGEALLTLAAREADAQRLEDAVAASRAALEELPRERMPLEWAVVQANLGCALELLGERDPGTAQLEEAVAAFGAALQVCTRLRAPLEWAAMQNNLGNALSKLGQREVGTSRAARLEEAVAAFQASLEERTRERVPLQWALTQNGLGNALKMLGEGDPGVRAEVRLEGAAVAFRAALEEFKRERVPLDWAMAQNSLGGALRALGERDSGALGTARLKEAVTAYRAALEEQTRTRVPLLWAQTQGNLGIALRALGERELGTGRLKEAVAAFRAALSERTRQRVPLQWALTQSVLGATLMTLGVREPGKQGAARLKEAVSAYGFAMEILSVAGAVPYRQAVIRNLALAKQLLRQSRS